MLDIDRVNMNTHRTEEFVKRCYLVVTDTKRKERLEKCNCKFCFYQPRLSGQAFTRYECQICKTQNSHPNTGTPALCNSCAQEHGLCVQCGADLEGRARRKAKWLEKSVAKSQEE